MTTISNETLSKLALQVPVSIETLLGAKIWSGYLAPFSAKEISHNENAIKVLYNGQTTCIPAGWNVTIGPKGLESSFPIFATISNDGKPKGCGGCPIRKYGVYFLIGIILLLIWLWLKNRNAK